MTLAIYDEAKRIRAGPRVGGEFLYSPIRRRIYRKRLKMLFLMFSLMVSAVAQLKVSLASYVLCSMLVVLVKVS